MDQPDLFTKPKLIGLYAPVMGSGKTEAAKWLVEKHGFRLVKFAGPLKAMAGAFLKELGYDDFTVEQYLEGSLKELPIAKVGHSCRYIMQTLGTEWGRQAVREDLWVRLASEKIGALLGAGYDVVVDDVRYLNEYREIYDWDGKMVMIHRPGAKNYGRHGCEGLLAGYEFDAIIDNTGTVAELREKIDIFVMDANVWS
jgi:hypothetical protein